MAFIVKKKVHGKEYYYLNETRREGKKVISKCLAYLGKDKKEAESKAKEIIGKDKKAKQSIHEKKSLKLVPKEISIDELAVFCKRRGFVYQSGDIYGGFAGFWDFGHLGTELKNNIKNEWWKSRVYQREDMIGIDGAIITHPKVWEASGHVESFSDIFVTCKKCKKPEKLDKGELEKAKQGKLKCECGGDYDLENSKEFKLMFETKVGQDTKAYLRPETAQLMFTNFKFIYDNARMKLPFGIAQIGKAYRNEIAPRDFLFRSREFEQMEIEYFIKKDMSCVYKIPDAEILIWSAKDQEANKAPVKMKIKDAFEKGIIKIDWHAYWLALEFLWFKNLGANEAKFRLRQHKKNELAHYCTDCWDLEYKFPFGWKELEGIADRGTYDLGRHEKFSRKDLKIFDEDSKEKFLPSVVAEPSLGVDRTFLVFLFDSYFYDEGRGNIVLKLNPRLAPIKAAVFPIVKKPHYERLSDAVFKDLSQEFNVIYDKSGSIGRRYARNDEIGTPFCITIDEESLKNKDVTIRNRDTTKQIRVKTANLRETLRNFIDGKLDFKTAGKLVK